MKKFAFSIISSLFFACTLHGQSKIFKEVGEDISTRVKTITQDNALVGYLAFTRLEKTDADSFNYRVTIMDENLKEIGTVNFRQEILDLQAVSFEQDVLCLGYIQSPLTGGESVRSRRDLRKAEDAAASSHILLQFINLNGKVVNTYYREVNLNTATLANGSPFSTMKMVGYLKYGMQIRNIANSGFAFFYGDEKKEDLVIFNIRGEPTHEQEIPTVANHFYLHASATEIYLMTKDDALIPEGGNKLYVYSAKNLDAENNFDLRDADGNWLKVLAFDNDPVTGDPLIAGCILHPRPDKRSIPVDYNLYAPYIGLFTLDLGNAYKDMRANCTYWSAQRIPGIARDGLFTDKDFYVRYATAFRDFSGNTIFAGSAVLPKGDEPTAKIKFTDGVFVRQDTSGRIALDNNIPCDETKYFGPEEFLNELQKRDYYKVDNPDTKTNYMIIDDEANIYIYNVTAKKLMRTIPHKDGNVKINVYPAKEGHMMVSEYNRKEKYTRFSIEAL